MQNNTDSKTRLLAAAAMFGALTLLATSVLKIPTPALGYIHIGDTFVLLSGIFLGPVWGGFAAGIGSALADLLGGYAVWVPGTFVIKFADAALAALVWRALGRLPKNGAGQSARLAVAGVAGEAVMTVGYFFYNLVVLSLSAGSFSSVSLASAVAVSVTDIPFDLAQGAVGIVLAVLLRPVFVKAASALTGQVRQEKRC